MPWSIVGKPAESLVRVLGTFAEPFGLLITITSVMTSTSSTTSGWGNIGKATSSVWTAVAKPTSSVWTNVVKPV